MAREKGMGSLQREKSGRWTMRVGINGKRYCRSTRTKDRDQAERVLQRFLAPFGLGEHRLPLADVWNAYVVSPNRNELAPATLDAKRVVWMHFAKWMEHNYLPVSDLAGISGEMIAEYLALLRANLCGSSYNNRVCVLREIFRTLAAKAGLDEDPWEGVRLRPDDSHSRRELTMPELKRLLDAACKRGAEWHKLILIGIYTGLRLGDCCRLDWSQVNLAAGVIQIVPRKTRRHHQRLVTIPIHPALGRALLFRTQSPSANAKLGETCAATTPTPAGVGYAATTFRPVASQAPVAQNADKAVSDCGVGSEATVVATSENASSCVSRSDQRSCSCVLKPNGPVLPEIAELYGRSRWRVSHELSRIFKAANITTSVRLEGRHRKTPEATFHSLRHTFVSFAANAGVPLHVVQSIVGHESTAMTRHYYHENIDALKSAVAAIPTL